MILVTGSPTNITVNGTNSSFQISWTALLAPVSGQAHTTVIVSLLENCCTTHSWSSSQLSSQAEVFYVTAAGDLTHIVPLTVKMLVGDPGFAN